MEQEEEKKPKSKRQEIREWLEAGNAISSMEAFYRFNVTRLSAIIFVLRRAGMDIVSESKTATDRFGRKSTYSVYRLANPANDAVEWGRSARTPVDNHLN